MPMLPNAIRWQLAILLLLPSWSSPAQTPAPPREFSADLVRRDADGAAGGPVAKLHVSLQKTRIDSTDASGGFFITDGEAGTAFYVRPAQHLYLDAKQSTPLTQIFVPVDPQDPCRQWQTAARLAGAVTADWRCERIRSALIDDRAAIEYQVLAPGHTVSQRWVESGLGFPVRSRAADGSTIALENVRIEAQPASLFCVPSDYRKLDPQALIEQIKHSDVWAEPER